MMTISWRTQLDITIDCYVFNPADFNVVINRQESIKANIAKARKTGWPNKSNSKKLLNSTRNLNKDTGKPDVHKYCKICRVFDTSKLLIPMTVTRGKSRWYPMNTTKHFNQILVYQDKKFDKLPS